MCIQEGKNVLYILYLPPHSFTKQLLYPGLLIYVEHLLLWYLFPSLLSFSPYWQEQTMKTTLANVSCLESSILVSNCWVAFFPYYIGHLWTACQAQKLSFFSGTSLPDLHGERKAALFPLGSKAHTGQEQSSDPGLARESLSRECGTVTESQLVSLHGWLEL